jgi:hypothetical protein
MKKFLSVLLSVITVFSVAIIPAVAEDSSNGIPQISQTDMFFEKVLGGLGSVFGTWFAPLRPDDTDMVQYICKK